ncbi:MAG: chromate transporter [Eubacteriaceae bacterium]|nr:chromate transporter [Eubacteriaceae bacterium]
MIYIKLFLSFAKIGIFGFGGGMAMLPMIYQSAQQMGGVSADEFSNLVGISQVTPGPIAVNAATYVGFVTAGYGGAIAATMGVAVPSFILVSLACYFINKFKESTVIKGAFVGIRPVTVGLIAAAVIYMGQSVFASVSLVPVLILLATLVAIGKLKVSPIAIVIGAGVIGAFLCG